MANVLTSGAERRAVATLRLHAAVALILSGYDAGARPARCLSLLRRALTECSAELAASDDDIVAEFAEARP